MGTDAPRIQDKKITNQDRDSSFIQDLVPKLLENYSKTDLNFPETALKLL